MIKTITFENEIYPEFQTKGFAAKYAFPFAEEVCTGTGLDIGCNRTEWSFPGSIPIDPCIDKNYDALNLPDIGQVDYIFSSHMLEHVPNWVEVLEYWSTKIKSGGTLFLYLPHWEQKYWRPWHNRRHIHIFKPEIFKEYFKSRSNLWTNVFVSERDLYHAFMVMAEKI